MTFFNLLIIFVNIHGILYALKFLFFDLNAAKLLSFIAAN